MYFSPNTAIRNEQTVKKKGLNPPKGKPCHTYKPVTTVGHTG